MGSKNEQRLVESVICTKFGGFDKIRIEKVPLRPPKCTDSLVEVEVTYCGVNFADIYTRQGLIPTVKAPLIMGLECCGIIRDVGPKVTSFEIGQRVVCYKGDGGLYRETVIVDEKHCFAVPNYIADEIAITLPANYLTAYFCLFDICTLLPDQRILIHSCAGGVGWALTQLAKTVPDVTVVGTASTSKHNEVQNNGVDYPIESKNYLQSLREHEHLKDKGFDVIIDNIGGSNIQQSLALLNTCGKVIVIGANHLITHEHKLSTAALLKSWWSTKHIDVRELIGNNRAIAGLHLAQLLRSAPRKVHDTFDRVIELMAKKQICPKIDLEVDFHEIVKGMKALAHRENIGKVVVKMTKKSEAAQVETSTSDDTEMNKSDPASVASTSSS